MKRTRSRMVLELPVDIKMAIRLRAAITHGTNVTAVISAIESAFPHEVKQARMELAATKTKRLAKQGA